MSRFVIAVIAACALLVAAEFAQAHGPVVVRRTPFRPFRGPVVVNRGFHGGNRGRGVDVQVDRFGNVRVFR